MKFPRCMGLAAITVFLATAPGARNGPSRQAEAISGSAKAGAEAELARLRADVIRSIQATRERLDHLLAIHEREIKKLTGELGKRRPLFEQGYLSRADVERTERALATAMTDAEEVRRWIMQDEIAMTEALARDDLRARPGLSRGGYDESVSFIRYNGGAAWSLEEAPKIEKFFSSTFGRALPVSAFGQTPVHERMKFDHRDAMDVAIHPDSAEGRALMAHLRRDRIPFLAFRGKMAGSSTGAHLHIGKPSIRDAAR